MKMLLALQEGKLKQQFFPIATLEELRSLGDLKENLLDSVLSQDELAQMLYQVEVCIVLAWNGSPCFTKEVLQHAGDLKLIVTPGGSVAPFITEAVYERGIQVCSANSVMARYVAEGTLAYMLTASREVASRHLEMKRGIWNSVPCRSLLDKSVGLIGLGTVGRYLLELLRPFNVKVKLYDPYISSEALNPYPNVTLCGLEEALTDQDFVSLHASKTQETYHMLSRERLSLLKDGAILINTARGSLIDEDALIDELQTGRIHAVLDVFETEPLPLSSKLRELDNVTLMPHVAGLVELEKLTAAMVEEIRRYQYGKELAYKIPVEQFRYMTR
jgi:phosphoglycerate dehydrogenase-like enzyme